MIKFSQICSVFKPSQTLKIRPPALRDIERYWEFVTLGVAAVFAASNASSAVAATQDLVQRFVARRKLRLSAHDRTTATADPGTPPYAAFTVPRNSTKTMRHICSNLVKQVWNKPLGSLDTARELGALVASWCIWVCFWRRLCSQTIHLDDGWLESVEEQGLLLLVWRHHITKQYIKDVL